ncbi:hypothetical protein ACRAWG_15515 [Methylobacterium sp. P31]
MFGGDLGLTLTGQDLTIAADRKLIVKGRLAFVMSGNITVSGTIAASDDLSLASGRHVAVSDSGWIYTRGNGWIQAAGNLTNTAGAIEADGSLGIKIGGTLTNARTAQRVTDVGPRLPSAHFYRRNHKFVDQLDEYAETSGAAEITAGDDLSIEAGAIVNDASLKEAGGYLILKAGSIDNLSRKTGVYFKTFEAKVGANLLPPIVEGWEEDTTKETTALLQGGSGVYTSGGRLTNTGTIKGPTVSITANIIVNGITSAIITTPPARLPSGTIDLAPYADGSNLDPGNDNLDGTATGSEGLSGIGFDLGTRSDTIRGGSVDPAGVDGRSLRRGVNGYGVTTERFEQGAGFEARRGRGPAEARRRRLRRGLRAFRS